MNALTPFPVPEYPSDAVIRRTQAERDARERWGRKYAQINDELQAELDQIHRDYREGKFG